VRQTQDLDSGFTIPTTSRHFETPRLSISKRFCSFTDSSQWLLAGCRRISTKFGGGVIKLRGDLTKNYCFYMCSGLGVPRAPKSWHESQGSLCQAKNVRSFAFNSSHRTPHLGPKLLTNSPEFEPTFSFFTTATTFHPSSICTMEAASFASLITPLTPLNTSNSAEALARTSRRIC